MRAIVHSRYGSPDVLSLRDIPKPKPGPKDVLVKVIATTVNRTDCALRAGSPWVNRLISGLLRPRQTTLGSEFSGWIEAVGSEVTEFRCGDAVFGLSISEYGAHAEYLCIPAAGPIAHKPQNLSFAEAAAIGEGPWYASNYLDAIQISDQHSILIYGATGSIGSSAVQLAHAVSADVTAVCHHKHLSLVRDLGAGTVVDFTQQDFTQLGSRFDFVFDAVGKTSFAQCRPLLKDKGIFFSTELGPYWQNPLLALSTPIFGGKKVIFPIPPNPKPLLLRFKALAETGKLRAVIDRSYPLEAITDAYRYAESGQKVGSLVILI